MTHFLASMLGASEPNFSHSIRQLEQAAGRPSADLRLISEIKQNLRRKTTELGLDPNDTTGPELYQALQQRLARDERLTRTVLEIPTDADAAAVLGKVSQFFRRYEVQKTSFALKQVVAKKLLAKKLPKVAMKRLGYRSGASMLKTEPVAQIYAAALLSESRSWSGGQKRSYKKLQASDFESRPIQFLLPKGKKWQKFAASVATNKPILSFPELGAIVFLPLGDKVQGLAITSLLLGLHEVNLLRAYSSFLKLQQVRRDFGEVLQATCNSEPQTGATLAGKPVLWRTIQRFYGHFPDAYHPEVFEPHVQREDLTWHTGEALLKRLAPAMAFWEGTQFLAVLHEGRPVSLNVLDAALSYCNQLPFNERVAHFVKDNIWHELMMRYLHQENLETAVHQQLSSSLAASPELAVE